MLGFQAKRRINKSILLRKWLRNISNVEDDEYETPILAYNRKLDLLVSTSSITRSDVEEKNSPPYPKDVMMNLEKKTKNLENTTLGATP
jgi:predicted ribosome quality control (RQC) complex YloA/Tae2 family protein